MQKKVLTTVLAASAIGAMVLSGCSSSKKTTGALGSTTPTAAASASAGGGSCNGTGTDVQDRLPGPAERRQQAARYQRGQRGQPRSRRRPTRRRTSASSSQSFRRTTVGTAAGALPAAAALIQDPAVVGVIGPSFSGATTAVGAKYAQAGIAMISPSATNATLTSQGFTTFHRIVPTDGIEGKATADYLADQVQDGLRRRRQLDLRPGRRSAWSRLS